jgi:hypothetical protein
MIPVTLTGRLALAALVATACATAPRAQAADDALPCDLTTPERIVAVGDVHGAFDRYVAILREAGIIDEDRKWAAGRDVFVQLGDVLHRGPDSRKVLDLLRDLERDAARAGGRVYYLLGNHEVMRMQADLRYVHPEEYAAFRSPDARDLRDRAYRVVVARQRAAARDAGEPFDERAFRAFFEDETPLGLVEMQMAFDPTGEYGEWLRRHDVILEINEVVFVHGGISPAVASRGCAAIAAAARAELREDRIADPGREALLLDSEDGPLWYRGLADGTATARDVDAVLDALGAARLVIGHTPTPDHRIATTFDGRVIAIDTGMLGGEWYPGGVASALEIRDGAVTAVYDGRRDVLIAKAPGATVRGR